MKRKFRELIIAPKDKIVLAADLSQAESWVVAYLANEERMKFALKYGDIHAQTSSIIYYPLKQDHEKTWKKEGSNYICTVCSCIITYEMRYLGKKCNHGTAYRMKGAQQAKSINKESDQPPYLVVTVEEAEKYNRLWHEYYNVRNWWYEIEEQLDRDRTIITPYRRARTFYGGLSNKYEREETAKEATAFVPQSTVCDHFTGAIQPELGVSGGLLSIFNNIVKPSNGDVELVNMSHDSCVLYAPKNMADEVAEETISYLLRPLVIKDEEFTIPVDVEVGDNLGNTEKWRKAA